MTECDVINRHYDARGASDQEYYRQHPCSDKMFLFILFLDLNVLQETGCKTFTQFMCDALRDLVYTI